MAVIIEFVAAKGGVGKSTLTSIFASYVHHYTNLSVCVVDADDEQETLLDQRKTEVHELQKEVNEKEYYNLISSNLKDVPQTLDLLKEEFDLILIDLPGNMGQEGAKESYLMADYLFLVTGLSQADLNSLAKFYKYLETDIKPLRQSNNLPYNIYGILAKVNPQTKEYKEIIAQKDGLPIQFLESKISHSFTKFARNFTTIKPYNDCQSSNLSEEILTILKNQ